MRSTATTVRVLETLAREPARWRHGYSIMEETGLQSGTIYPILRRLADHSMLESRWEAPAEPGRPARHLYRLTTTGVERALSEVRGPQMRPTTFRVVG